MKFYEIQASPHGAAPVEYDSSEPMRIEEALSREVPFTTAQPVGGKDVLLRKTDSEYVLTVTTPPAGPSRKFLYQTLVEALKAAEELEG